MKRISDCWRSKSVSTNETLVVLNSRIHGQTSNGQMDGQSKIISENAFESIGTITNQ